MLKMVEQDGTLESADRARRIASLQGSLGRLERITPEFRETYLRAWAIDSQRWQRHLKEPFIHDIQQLSGRERRRHAVSTLRQPGAPRLTWRSGGQGSPCP